ncbi:MAG: ATP synthase F0 subunit C [Candidatus Methylacidiphilales bacterium]
MIEMLSFAVENAEVAVKANWTVAIAALASAFAVGWIGSKSAEAVGRNPGAFGQILTIGIIGMALAEAIVFYAIFLV